MGKRESEHEDQPVSLFIWSQIMCWSEVSSFIHVPNINKLSYSSLATMQMKIHIGVILRKYRIEGHPDTTTHSMEPLDFFQGKPRDGKCLLYFKKDE